jgi:hypothetical protein
MATILIVAEHIQKEEREMGGERCGVGQGDVSSLRHTRV